MALLLSVQIRSLLMPSDWKRPDMWEHYCEYQRDVMGFPKGVECDWCGETESTFNEKRSDIVYNYHPQDLLLKKILPPDVFYKLFKSEEKSEQKT